MKARAMQIVRESELIPSHDGWHPLSGHQAPEYVPTAWDGPHAGLRLVQAFKTLARLPMPHHIFSNSGYWPSSRMEWVDRVEIERDWRLNPGCESLRDALQQWARRRGLPSAEEISRMELAIAWPARYLARRPRVMRVVQRVAVHRARGIDSDVIAHKLHMHVARLRRINRTGLDEIAAGLRANNVVMF